MNTLISSLLLAGRNILALLVIISFAVQAEESLTIVNYGGSYAKACMEGRYMPYMEATGVKVKLEDYNGGIAQIRAQAETGSVHWDVVSISAQDALRACDEGIIIELDDIELAASADGSPVDSDYYPDTNFECALSTIFWASIIAYNPRFFEGDKPTKLADFFDLERFPGRRGMRREPHTNLEMALMADGVPPDEVYATLSTEAGLKRAFAKIDTIKDKIVWWEAGAQPPQMLADGEITMSIAWNGRIFNAQVRENQPFEIIWDGRIMDISYLAVVAGAPNMENAREFIRFASRPDTYAGISNRIAYAPTRKSALALVDKHIPTGVDMMPHMPTNPEHPGEYLQVDTVWWADHSDELTERFSIWLQQ